MASETAQSTAPPPSRPLWHVPLFLLGLAALGAAWFGRPIWPEAPARLTKRDLALARAAVDKADGNLEYALKLANRAMQASQKLTDFAGESAFITGSVHLKLAEKAGPRSEHWVHARAFLDQALLIGVSEEDRPRMEYRLARAGLQTGMEPRTVAAYLESAAAHADSKVEAFSLLTDVYLRMTPPELEKALAANLKLRNAEDLSESEANRAKLQGAEIELRRRQPASARKTLEKIDDRAPAEVLQRARLLRARAYQDQEFWKDAALQYQAALADTRYVPPDAPLARYNLGLCYRGMELRGEAIRAWEACLTNAKPAEYTAAAIALAEAHLDEPALEPTLDALTRSVEHLKPGAKWTNPHVDRSKLLKVFDRAKVAFQQAERFDLLYKLVTPQSKWLSAEASLVARAEAALLWGQALKKSSGLEDIQRSNTLLVEAGDLFEQASREKDLPPEKQADRLFQSALAFQAADQPDKGASSLFRLKTLPAKAELLSEANYRLGEYYRSRGEKTKALEMYRDCIKYDSRYVAHAHLRIAMYDLEEQRMEEAEAGLVAILRNLAWDADPEIKAEALNALANLLYTRKDYRRVVFYLENALKLFNENAAYRSTANYTRLRFLLADSYQQVAALETTELGNKALTLESRRFHEQRRELFLQKAVKELDGLDSYLLSEKGSSHLTPKQRAEVPFLLASCLFRLGKYADALKIYERIASKNDNSLEYIVALGGAIKCLGELRQEDKIRQRLLQIENALPNVPEPHAQNWKEWVKKARMALAPIPE